MMAEMMAVDLVETKIVYSRWLANRTAVIEIERDRKNL